MLKEIIISGLLTLTAATAHAAVVLVNVEGRFSSGFNGQPLDPAFPNPALANGRFNGSFTYDDAALPFFSDAQTSSYNVLSNHVELRTPSDAIDYTITIDGNNEIRLIATPGSERLIIYLGDSTTTSPDDLRLAFDITGLGLLSDGSPLTAAEFLTAVTQGTFMPDPFSLLDAEGVPSDHTLGIAAAGVTVARGGPVPEPGSLSLLGVAFAGLFLRSRRLSRK